MSAQSLILIRLPKIVQTGFVFYLSTFVGVEFVTFPTQYAYLNLLLSLKKLLLKLSGIATIGKEPCLKI